MTAERGGTQTHNHDVQSSDGWNWPGWLQAGATLGLLIFAGWQMCFVRRSTKATEDAANAASDNAIASKAAAEASKQMAESSRESVQLAEDAIHTNRPHLFVTNVQAHRAQRRGRRNEELIEGVVIVRNYGTGPGEITDYVARIELFPADKDPSPEGLYEENEGQPLEHPYYGAGDEDIDPERTGYKARITTKWQREDNQLANIVANRERLAIHGRLRYRGSAKRPYVSHFFWWIQVNRTMDLTPVRGPKELNTHD